MGNSREKKETEDKIIFDSIQQLHNAVLQFSNNTMEVKKLFVSVLIAFFTIIITVNPSITSLSKMQLIILGVIDILFWMLDAQSYYYQKKLRKQITDLQEKLKGSVNCTKKKSIYVLIRDSIFNPSMFIYIVVPIILFFAKISRLI